MPKIKLTKSVVDTIPFTEKGQRVYFDTDMIGFGLVVGKRTKTYAAQRQIGPKTVRVTIGRHGIFTPDEARKEARQLLALMAKGINPNEKKRQEQSKSITVRDAFSEYLISRSTLKSTTRKCYERVLRTYFVDWADKPFATITADQVAERHIQIGAKHGEPTANTAMRVLRAVYNFTTVLYEDLPPNPVNRLTRTRAWFRERRRHTVIQIHQLPIWYAAVNELENRDARDFLLLLLFSGMRRSEGLRLRWADIDLQACTLLVPETKNHEPLRLPLSDFLRQLLAERRILTGPTEYVFPGSGRTGHLQEPKKFIHQVRIASGVGFTLHDLRRTFITMAESLDISVYALKRLINHKSGGDVTAGYIVLNVERLRAPMQLISNRLLELCEENEPTVNNFITR